MGRVHRGQKLLNLALAEMLLDKADIRHPPYHLEKSHFQVTLRVAKPEAQPPHPRKCSF